MAKREPSDEEFRLMQALQEKLTSRQLAKITAPNVTKMYTRKMIQDAFLETFELVGGVNRLAIWANETENYEIFLKLLMQLAPKEAAGKGAEGGKTIEYRSMVPQSKLNDNTKKPVPLTIVDDDVIEGETDV